MDKATLKRRKIVSIVTTTPSVTGLTVVRDLLDRLHERGIAYCHWKSNQHLLQGMLGETDLDVLVAKDRLVEMTEVLCQAGYKRFRAVPSSEYPAIEDYLAMDQSTGKLVHLHLHYRLVAGEPHLKGYRLPWESVVLSSRVFLGGHGIYTSCPEVEIILLIVRAALKLRMRDGILALLGQSYPSRGMVREYSWLQSRIDLGSFEKYATQLLGEEPAGLLKEMVRAGSLTYEGLIEFRKHAMVVLGNYRTYGVAHGRIVRWLREADWALGVMSRRYLHLAIPFRRGSAGGGLVVALLGCDGSGKSTHIKEITKWLSWKLDVLPIYFGSGDGPSSLLRWPLKFAADIMRRKGPTGMSKASMRLRDDVSWYKRFGRVPWALFLAMEKRKKLKRLWLARNRGMIVLCDRFPQNQIKGFNDGPLLGHYGEGGSGLKKRIAAWEASCYALAARAQPELVLKLHVSPEVAFSRRPNMAVAGIRRRIDAVRQLRFDPVTRVSDIDATRPLEEVALEIRRRVWEAL